MIFFVAWIWTWFQMLCKWEIKIPVKNSVNIISRSTDFQLWNLSWFIIESSYSTFLSVATDKVLFLRVHYNKAQLLVTGPAVKTSDSYSQKKRNLLNFEFPPELSIIDNKI